MHNAEAKGADVAKGQVRSSKEPRKPKAKAPKRKNFSSPSKKALGSIAHAH